MLNLEFDMIIKHFKNVEKQLETQNLIQIVINPKKSQNFSKKDIGKFKDIIKARL